MGHWHLLVAAAPATDKHRGLGLRECGSLFVSRGQAVTESEDQGGSPTLWGRNEKYLRVPSPVLCLI